MARIQLEGILKLIDVDINPAIFQKISRAVSNLPIALQQTGRAAQNAQSQMQGLTTAVGNTNKQLSLGASFANKFLQRMAQFAILLPIFATLNKALQGSVKFMTEFESELLNIARVDPTATVEKLSRISAVALDIGVQFGASSLEVLKTVKVFVQAGESIESALEKARVATLATQVSTLNLAQAQELLIGVSKQFRSEALADIDILDKVARVEDQSAADAAELAEAFVTGGNAIAFATKSFDDSIGIIAALREQTRKSGREIGTFLKTLATRILAAGESRTALEQLGVVVEDQAGNLRPLLAILKDTKLAFDGLTESEAANAAKAIGGVRQFESLLATLQSLEKAQKLSSSSTRSQGAADQKLSIVQEKLSFQVGQTVSEFQRLAVMLGDNGMLDFFKEGVKALRLFAVGLEGAVDLADSLGVSLVPLLAAGGFKIGQIAFGGKNKQQQVQNQSPTYQPQFQGTGYGSRSAFRNMAYQRSQSTNFVGSNANPNTNADAMKFVALQSAAVAAGLALKGLEKAFADSTGSMEILGNTTKDTVEAMQTAFQVSAVLGPKAGAFAGALDIIVASASRIMDAFDERSKDLAEIDANTKNFKSAKGLNLDAQAGQVLTTPILKAMADAFSANGGQIGDA